MSRAAERIATRIRHQRTSSFGSASEACAPEAIRHQAERASDGRNSRPVPSPSRGAEKYGRLRLVEPLTSRSAAATSSRPASR
jgi:hypothetical protein